MDALEGCDGYFRCFVGSRQIFAEETLAKAEGALRENQEALAQEGAGHEALEAELDALKAEHGGIVGGA